MRSKLIYYAHKQGVDKNNQSLRNNKWYFEPFMYETIWIFHIMLNNLFFHFPEILQDWMDVDMAKVDAAVEMPIKLNQEDE